jgi:hypothetical protein
LLAAMIVVVYGSLAFGQTYPSPPESILTPDRAETRIGVLDLKDGTPSLPTVQKVYDNLDFTHALNVFLDGFQCVGLQAIRDGARSVGLRDNQILLFSDLMDSNSLYLTGDADAVRFLSFIDLSRGPVVFEAPPNSHGTINDLFSRWVIDFGSLGPDRGEGGRYLLLPSDYTGPLPEGGFYVARARTSRVCMLGHAFWEKNDPKPAVERIKKTAKIYRYDQGAAGTSVAQFLGGKSKLASPIPSPPSMFIEGSERVFSMVPPNDFRYFEMLHTLLQQEPVDALDPDFVGQLAAIGILKGEPFRPDARMRKMMAEAAAAGNATARTLFWNPRESERFAYYSGSAWIAPLWVGGYDFMNPPPLISILGAKPAPSTGGRTLNARLAYFYTTVGVSPTRCMRVPGMGMQYIVAALDVNKNYLDGGKSYKLNLPKDLPQARCWSLTVYDNQTRSMLKTAQRFPMLGSQVYPRPVPNPSMNGSIDVYFGPKAPANLQGNWIQTEPEKGWFVILRLYEPLDPFFKKTWRPGEIEPAK